MADNRLHYETVSPLLRNVLHEMMSCEIFAPFLLVGGTALSLQLGHRVSDDIDLFTDAEYGSLDFQAMQSWLRDRFPYCIGDCGTIVGFGASYIVGNSREESVKVDLFYTDAFIHPAIVIDGIRLAAQEEIAAMKLDVVSHKGRKKDFWDLHELHGSYTFVQMLDYYAERYPYGATRNEASALLTDFSRADEDVDPRCLRRKIWQLIKLDIAEWTEQELTVF